MLKNTFSVGFNAVADGLSSFF